MNLFAALKHGLEALKVGRSLNNLSAWKNAQAVSSLLVVGVACVRALGVDFGIDDSTLAAIGVAIAALVNAYLTWATSDKVGLAPYETSVASIVPKPVTFNPVKTGVEDYIPTREPSPRPEVPDDSKKATTQLNPSKGTVGAIRDTLGLRMPDRRTQPIERRGQPNRRCADRGEPDAGDTDSTSGWNDR